MNALALFLLLPWIVVGVTLIGLVICGILLYRIYRGEEE